MALHNSRLLREGPGTEWLQHLRQLLSVRTGLTLREQDLTPFHKTLGVRLAACGLRSEAEYCRFLETESSASDAEWSALAGCFTNGESYFFRDEGQLALLRNLLFPELIERRKLQRTLKIWSAGCSTGEEPYSIALILDQLLEGEVKDKEWNISILATDINEQALEKARRGIYGPWSFRSVRPDQIRGLSPGGGEWIVDERIRKMVTFRSGNLVRDEIPLGAGNQIDFILCRNVFIYLNQQAISTVLHKFAAALQEDGYLMTGHAELPWHDRAGLHSVVFPESVVYRHGPPTASKSVQPRAKAPKRPTPHPRPGSLATWPVPAAASRETLTPERKAAAVSHPAEPATDARVMQIRELERLLERGACEQVLKGASTMLQARSQDYAVLYLLARASADLGDHSRSYAYCEQALGVSAFHAAPYRLMAMIKEEQGDSEGAKQLLKRAIYLSPSFVAAYLDLAGLYEKSNDAVRARKMRDTAIALLNAMPGDAPVESLSLTAAELIRELEAVTVGVRR